MTQQKSAFSAHSTLLAFGAVASALLISNAAHAAPSVKEWFALGSGCRAKHDVPGDVSVRVLKSETTGTNTLAVAFSLPQYRLEGEAPIRPQNPTFARECALRMALKMPPNTRIRSVRTAAPFVVSKDVGAKLRLAAQLHLGNTIVDSKLLELASETKELGKPQLMSLFAAAESPLVVSSEPFPQQECGTDKLLGVDLSITNWRDSFTPKVSVGLSTPPTLLVTVESENCVSTLDKRKN